ncbi:SDR family oxidoreductase [bacterium RCC_150]
MNPTYDFSGQVALATAAASGLGLATAQQFAVAGAAVVIADMNEAAVFETEQTFRDAGHEVDHDPVGPVDAAEELAENYDPVNAGLTTSAAVEYAARGIKINAMRPGTIDTQMVDQFVEKGDLVLANSLCHAPIDRIGRPEEIASVVLRCKSRRRGLPSCRRRLCGLMNDQTLLEEES